MSSEDGEHGRLLEVNMTMDDPQASFSQVAEATAQTTEAGCVAEDGSSQLRPGTIMLPIPPSISLVCDYAAPVMADVAALDQVEPLRAVPATAFSYFSQLPMEIRSRIWQFAIDTDETPRIHYYNLFNYNVAENWHSSSIRQMLDHYDRPTHPRHPHPLSTTTRNYSVIVDGERQHVRRIDSQTDELAWTSANRLQNLWDFGLHTACKESRHILLRHLHHSGPLWLPSERGHVISVIHDNNEKVQLRVAPYRDLICLRFSPHDLEATIHMNWGAFLAHLPLLNLPTYPNFNLALEFDVTWLQNLGARGAAQKVMLEPSLRGLTARAFWAWQKNEIPRWARLWLIDRSRAISPDYLLAPTFDGRFLMADRVYRYRGGPNLCDDHVFSDGRDRYVESYQWNNEVYYRGPYYSPNACAVLLFMSWLLRNCCITNKDRRDTNLPLVHNEAFIRVLHQVPRDWE